MHRRQIIIHAADARSAAQQVRDTIEQVGREKLIGASVTHDKDGVVVSLTVVE